MPQKLFLPLRLGSLDLTHRVVMAPSAIAVPKGYVDYPALETSSQ